MDKEKEDACGFRCKNCGAALYVLPEPAENPGVVFVHGEYVDNKELTGIRCKKCGAFYRGRYARETEGAPLRIYSFED